MGAWLREDGADAAARRAAVLIDVLRHGLNLVVIDLGDDDEAQVIFETLNARGTPLLPADLVKNYLFHAAAESQADLDTLYAHWKPFRRGRVLAQGRAGPFLPPADSSQHYLTLVTRGKVSDDLFSEFRVAGKPQKNPLAATAVSLQARWDRTRRGVFFQRLTAMDTKHARPFSNSASFNDSARSRCHSGERRVDAGRSRRNALERLGRNRAEHSLVFLLDPESRVTTRPRQRRADRALNQ